jgi:hypothetical protein
MKIVEIGVKTKTVMDLTSNYTYHSRVIPQGVAEASQIFLRDAYVLPKLLSYEEYFRDR